MLFATSVVTPSIRMEEAPKPYLFSLKGIYTHPISTKSPVAQQYFDQGMVFYFGYNYEEAARSFAEAAALDPTCAICFWGIALSSRGIIASLSDPRISFALENTRKAQQLMAGATPQEQAYITALANSYLPHGNSLQDMDKAFTQEMKQVSERYPNDPDAATLYGKFALDITPPNQLEGVKKVFQAVIKNDPNHPGANHYYIHAVESSLSNPAEGLDSAKRLEHLVPFAGHLLHMPAHIYLKTGQFHEATLANERALQADEDLFAKGGVKGDYYSSFYLHNFQFLIASLVMEGKKNEALQVARKLGAIIDQGKLVPSPYMINVLSAQRLLILQRFDDWKQILNEPLPGTPFGNGMWHYSRTLAFLAQNDLGQAKAEASAILNERADPSNEPLNVLLKVVALNAGAAIAERVGNIKEMIGDYQEAIKLEDQIPYFEPPVWFISSREAFGHAMLRAGKRKEAENLFQEDLKYHPKKIWSLKGMRIDDLNY